MSKAIHLGEYLGIYGSNPPKQQDEKKDEASKGESESHLSVEVFSSKTSFPFTTFRDSLDMNLG